MNKCHDRRPTNTFFNKIFIKTEFHDTIHTFKNYFVTVFLIFNFSNKSYLNRPQKNKIVGIASG